MTERSSGPSPEDIAGTVLTALDDHVQVPRFSLSPEGLGISDAYRVTTRLRAAFEARGEKIREGGGDPFRDDALPRAVIRFKQGFGRLIRSATDMGQVVILDPRVLTTGYGRSFLKAIPGGVEVERI